MKIPLNHRIEKVAALLAVMGALSASLDAATVIDDFNRPDGTNLGPNWVERAGDWSITSNRATGTDLSLMTFSNAFSSLPVLQVDAIAAASRVDYIALVSLYNNLSDNVFVKVQDQVGDGFFDRIFFYYGNNGSAWAGMTGGNYFEDTSTPFSSARITTTISGNSVTLGIDTNFDGTPEQTYTRGVFPFQTWATSSASAITEGL